MGIDTGSSRPFERAGTSSDDAATAVVARPRVDASVPTSVAVGASVGRYVVLEEVGRGGMGRVLRAYDPKLQREVALKEVRRDVLGTQGARQLVAEARAMAQLSHPRVVAVYDVEELEDGAVALAMEYVAGTTLRVWLAEHEHSWKAIVDRFTEAGRGLAAAHGAGLLHRDFKPANVLVGSSGTVKVGDFGLAKVGVTTAASSGDSAQPQGSTQTGTVMGTPRYMAPEQHRGEQLTPAADQYGYCVALWEALCGEPPFSGKRMAALKREGPPAWPSPTVPRPIAEAVRRGLAPKPNERWPSMETLLDALSYDPSKRRHRWLLALGGIVVLGVSLGAWERWASARAQRCTGASGQLVGVWDDARREKVRTTVLGIGASYADAVWTRTAEDVDRYADEWTAMHAESCEATTVRGEQSSEVMDLRMRCLQRAKVELAAVTDVLADADADVVTKASKVVGGLPPLSRCADVEALQAEVEPPLPSEADAVEAIRVLLAEAKASQKAGRFAAAHGKVQEAKDGLFGLDYGPVGTNVLLAEGRVLERLGKYEESEAALRDALGRASQWHQRDVMREAASALMVVVGSRQQRMEEALQYRGLAEGLAAGNPRNEAASLNILASILQAQGKYEEAEAEHRRALALREQALGRDHPDVATSRNNLATVLEAQGEYEEAEAEHRRALMLREHALGPEHPDVAGSRGNLAVALHAQGKYEEAEAEHRRALMLREHALGPEHPYVATSRSNLANVLYAQGKYEEAEAEHRRALVLREHTLGSEHPHVAVSRSNLANVLQAQGKSAEAEAEYRLALSLSEDALGPGHRNVAVSRNNLANVLKEQGKYAEAEVEARHALALLEHVLGREHPNVATSRNNLANVLEAQGKDEEAEAEYRGALALREQALGHDHPDVAMSRSTLAALLLDRGRIEEALALAEQAWNRRLHSDIPAGKRAETAFVLARTLWEDGLQPDRARARALAEQALEVYAGDDAHADARQADEVRAWLRARASP